MSTAQSNAITLKGSTEIVAEFFYYGINSILYQRGIYPPETFSRQEKYGLTVLVSSDELLKNYLDAVTIQLKDWLLKKTIQRLVVVIKCTDTNETLERWQFDIHVDKQVTSDSKPKEKGLKEIRKDIAAVIRQITASVTFLPLLETTCAFDLLVYTDKDMAVPDSWDLSDPHFVQNALQVKLKSFSTTVHKVDAAVCYKEID